jgi:hypothetical protein
VEQGDLLWGLLFGSIGLGYLVYGRRQRALLPFVAGIALVGLPYFVDGNTWRLLLGAAFIALPMVVKL